MRFPGTNFGPHFYPRENSFNARPELRDSVHKLSQLLLAGWGPNPLAIFEYQDGYKVLGARNQKDI